MVVILHVVVSGVFAGMLRVNNHEKTSMNKLIRSL
jgi:hypothetical protein